MNTSRKGIIADKKKTRKGSKLDFKEALITYGCLGNPKANLALTQVSPFGQTSGHLLYLFKVSEIFAEQKIGLRREIMK